MKNQVSKLIDLCLLHKQNFGCWLNQPTSTWTPFMWALRTSYAWQCLYYSKQVKLGHVLAQWACAVSTLLKVFVPSIQDLPLSVLAFLGGLWRVNVFSCLYMWRFVPLYRLLNWLLFSEEEKKRSHVLYTSKSNQNGVTRTV